MLSVAIRAFVVAALGDAAHEGARDDVRLLASELLAAAAESGVDIDLEFSTRPDGWDLVARGVADAMSAPVHPALAVRRLDVLSAVAQVSIDGDRVVCSRAAAAQSNGP